MKSFLGNAKIIIAYGTADPLSLCELDAATSNKIGLELIMPSNAGKRTNVFTTISETNKDQYSKYNLLKTLICHADTDTFTDIFEYLDNSQKAGLRYFILESALSFNSKIDTIQLDIY